jgi:chemotaxis protein MotB
MAAKGGGAWKVAYADFVTAMMAFFLVMWITAQNNAVKRAIAQYFQDPLSNSMRTTGGPPILPSNKSGQPPGPSILPASRGGSAIGVDSRRIKFSMPHNSNNVANDQEKEPQEMESNKPSLFVIHNGERRFLGTMILFPEGSAKLDKTAKDRLMQVVNDLRGKPQKIEIRGHATRSSTAPGSAGKDPWQMSYARCQAVMNFLVEHGIGPERIRLSQGGAYEPYSLEADPSRQLYNSRVEVYVLDEYAENLMGTLEERAKRFATP